MNNYIINNETIAIIPYEKKKSMIFEVNKKLVINKSPNSIIKNNCLLYGSSILGRLKGTEKLTGYTYKAPIIIKENELLIFFPTNSPRVKTCSWLSVKYIEEYYYDKIKKINVIRFSNNMKLELNVSLNIINNQISRALQLENKVRKMVY